MSYLGIFTLQFKNKTIAIFDINTLRLVQRQIFKQNKKLSIQDQKCFIWVFLPCDLKTKLLSFLKLTISDSSKYEVSIKIKKLSIQVQKCLIWVFLCCNLKKLWSYLNQHSQIDQNTKFQAKQKSFTFGTKNAIFESLYATVFFPNLKRKLLLYLKSAPSNLSKFKFCAKVKYLEFG